MEIERAGLSGEMKGPRQLVEAIVVLDLCDSTVMANRYGDAFALQLKEAIRTLVRPVLADKGVAFLKGTGDGFLATFPDLHKAAEAAVWIHGVPVIKANLPRIRREVGLLFQDPEDQVIMTRVGNEIAFGLENVGAPPATIWLRLETSAVILLYSVACVWMAL